MTLFYSRFKVQGSRFRGQVAASPQKGSQPRLAALSSPFQGKGLAERSEAGLASFLRRSRHLNPEP